MGLRLFIAVELPDEIRSSLAAAQTALRARPGADQVRWTDPRGAHLTLKFLGDTEERQMPVIQASLGDVCGHFGPVALHLTAVGAFPNALRPRVLWVGLGPVAGGEGLIPLQSQIERAMAHVGFAREERGFSPHLTLGRVREGANGVERMLAPAPDVPATEFVAAEVSLMRSVLGPAGAIYTRLFAAPLARQSQS